MVQNWICLSRAFVGCGIEYFMDSLLMCLSIHDEKFWLEIVKSREALKDLTSPSLWPGNGLAFFIWSGAYVRNSHVLLWPLSQGHQKRRQQGTGCQLDYGALDLPYDIQDFLTPVLNYQMTRCYHTKEFTFEKRRGKCAVALLGFVHSPVHYFFQAARTPVGFFLF